LKIILQSGAASIFVASVASLKWNLASNFVMKEPAREPSIFGEQYRVVAVEGDRLMVRGVVSGNVLTIVNPQPEVPLTEKDYPPGKLIALTDPSTSPLN
jgi:hypothetical protein